MISENSFVLALFGLCSHKIPNLSWHQVQILLFWLLLF